LGGLKKGGSRGKKQFQTGQARFGTRVAAAKGKKPKEKEKQTQEGPREGVQREGGLESGAVFNPKKRPGKIRKPIQGPKGGWENGKRENL